MNENENENENFFLVRDPMGNNVQWVCENPPS